MLKQSHLKDHAYKHVEVGNALVLGPWPSSKTAPRTPDTAGTEQALERQLRKKNMLLCECGQHDLVVHFKCEPYAM